jgi:hypothetical protein
MCVCVNLRSTSFHIIIGHNPTKRPRGPKKGSRCIVVLFFYPRLYVGVGGQRHATAALPSGSIRYPLCRRLGGSQGRSKRVWKISPSTGNQSPDRPARSESLYRLTYPGLPLGTSLPVKQMFHVHLCQYYAITLTPTRLSLATCSVMDKYAAGRAIRFSYRNHHMSHTC